MISLTRFLGGLEFLACSKHRWALAAIGPGRFSSTLTRCNSRDGFRTWGWGGRVDGFQQTREALLKTCHAMRDDGGSRRPSNRSGLNRYSQAAGGIVQDSGGEAWQIVGDVVRSGDGNSFGLD